MSNQGDKSHHNESVTSDAIQNAGPIQKQSFASKNANAYQSRETRAKKLNERLNNFYQERVNEYSSKKIDHSFSLAPPQIDLTQYYSCLQEQKPASASPMTFFGNPFHKAQQNKSSESIAKKQEITSLWANQIQEDAKVVKKPPLYKDYMNKIQEQKSHYRSPFGNGQYTSPFGIGNSMTLKGISPQNIGKQYQFKHNFKPSDMLKLKQIQHKQKLKQAELQSLMEEYDYPPIQKPVYPPALKAYSESIVKSQQYTNKISYLIKVDYLFEFNIHDLNNMDFMFQSIVITRAYQYIKRTYQESQKDEELQRAYNSWSLLYAEVQRRKLQKQKLLNSY